MQGRECCNVPGPPYCTNPTKSKVGHGSVLAVALLVALLAALLPKCSSSFFAPSLMLISRGKDRETQGGSHQREGGLDSSNDEGVKYALHHLQEIWEKHVSLKSYLSMMGASAACFAEMQVAFDFQPDSVKNQYEHFISLLRSHVAVVADRREQTDQSNDQRVCKDAMASVRHNFQEKVIKGAAKKARWKAATEKFPALWDRIIYFMHCEDKLVKNDIGKLKYDFAGHYEYVLRYEDKFEDLLRDQRLVKYDKQETRPTRTPQVFTSSSLVQRSILRELGCTDGKWPGNLEAEADGIHERQQRRYYSCLIDASCNYCDKTKNLRREPRLRVELPGFPILGDGKGDNQNTGIHFSRGSIIQCIDANQGGYFEQMLLLPCALGEFRQENKRPGLNPRIVGFAEHITSDIGSLGDFAAGAETAFGTVLQRCYSFLGGRMHYGHPDMMNKEGSDSRRARGGSPARVQGAAWTDLGFNTILTFFAKLSAGTGEQLLTRQVLRLGHELDLPEFLTFYYAHGGFYLTQFFLSKSIPLLVFIWLVAVFDDAEQNFGALAADQDADKKSGAAVMATFLATQFSKLLLLFIVAQMAPLFMQAWLEGSALSALKRIFKQMVTLAPLHFVFQAKIIGAFITNEVTLGGAKYMPTGRGLPTQRRHRMAQDIFVSSLILALLSFGGLLCCCGACGCHNLLIYRDIGGAGEDSNENGSNDRDGQTQQSGDQELPRVTVP
eukprot:Skav206217  [mRNA]  locus=scaffold1844:536165:551436:- [translate_table: standard]